MKVNMGISYVIIIGGGIITFAAIIVYYTYVDKYINKKEK
jgi:hypothetical protein